MPSQFSEQISQAAELIKNADGLLITAGAGMGVDSGLPDFRGENGFWNAYPGLAQQGLDFRSIATPNSFLFHPKLAWGFYGHRIKLYRDTTPHTGFTLLKEIAEQRPRGYFVYTSNVDGQFQRAGFPESRVVECHGSLAYLQCQFMCSPTLRESRHLQPRIDMASNEWLGSLPYCSCGALLRPNVLMFNDHYWLSHRSIKQLSLCDNWERTCKNLVVLELGAGLAVVSIRLKGESMNAPLIRVNPRDCDAPSKGVALPLSALEAITHLHAKLTTADR